MAERSATLDPSSEVSSPPGPERTAPEPAFGDALKDRLLERLAGLLPPEEIRRWFGPLTWDFEAPAGPGAAGRLRLTTPTVFHQKRLAEKYLDLLSELAAEVGYPRVEARTARPGPGAPQANIVLGAAPGASWPVDRTPLDPDHTFQRFLIGGGNRLAAMALAGFADDFGAPPDPEAPAGLSLEARALFVAAAGPWGKTHLLEALTRRLGPDRRPLMLAGGADQHGPSPRLWREARLIIVDDVHLLADRPEVQQRLVQAFDEAAARSLGLVFSAPALSAAKLGGLSESLRSRLGGCLVLRIDSPEFDLMLELAARQAAEQNLPASPEILALLAGEARGDPRRLAGLMRTLAFLCTHGRLSPAEAVARLNLNRRAAPEAARVGLPAILDGVAAAFGLKISDLTGHSKLRQAAWPRRVAIFLARELTDLTTTEIGVALGGRDHSTIIHALKKIHEELENPTQRQLVENIKQTVLVPAQGQG